MPHRVSRVGLQMRSHQFYTKSRSSDRGKSHGHVSNKLNETGGLNRREMKKGILLLPILEALPTARPIVDLLELGKRYVDFPVLMDDADVSNSITDRPSTPVPYNHPNELEIPVDHPYVALSILPPDDHNLLIS